MSVSPPLIKTPTLIQDDLILTNYNCKDPSSKKGHILMFWVDLDLEGTRFNPVHQLCDLWQVT